MEYKKSEKYKYVYTSMNLTSVNTVTKWHARVGRQQQSFETEIEAAKWVDLQLIDQGREPVNILIRKKTIL